MRSDYTLHEDNHESVRRRVAAIKTGRVLVGLFALITLGMGLMACASNQQTVVVYGSKAQWVHSHAAEEFAKYAEQLTGDRPAIRTDTSTSLKGYDTVVLIGNRESNLMVRRLVDHGLCSFDSIQPGSDGFIIKSIRQGKRTYLVLGGNRDRATLYAVYHYLDKFCKVGFFEDGEHIPNIRLLPVRGISLVSNPRFSYRLKSKFGTGHVMLNKYTHHFWTWEDYKRNIDYWAKRKLNMTGECLLTEEGMTLVDDIVQKVFDVGPQPQEITRNNGWPVAYDWPTDYVGRLLRNEIRYSRRLGFEFDYFIGFGEVPARFKSKHPEIKYLPGTNLIDPSDPRGKEYTEKFVGEIIKELGTDHIYSCGIYGEQAPGENPFQTKVDATLQTSELLKKLDPNIKFWRMDAWDYMMNPGGIWTKASVREYLSVLPKGSVYIADNTADMTDPPTYERNGYYYGHKWAFAVINQLAGQDFWVGDLQDVLSKVKAVAESPEGANCIGFHMMPENVGTVPLYWQFMSELAWNPQGVTVDGFLKDYVVRRYGGHSDGNMLKCYKYVVQAMKHYHVSDVWGLPSRMPLYRFWGEDSWQRELRNAPDQFGIDMASALNDSKLWLNAIDLALLEQRNQAGKKLYENDLLDMTRGYLSCLFDYHFSRFALAARDNDSETMDESERNCLSCLDWLEKVLSTRKDFSLENDIKRIMQVPGTNPNTPRYVRERYIFSNYCLVDSLELMHYYNRPRVEAVIAKLRGKPAPTFEDIANCWIRGPITVDDGHRFKGTTIQAIREAVRHTSAGSTY